MLLMSLFSIVVVPSMLLSIVTAHPPFLGKVVQRSELSHKYDYIIVGGGLSGLVVANRLSEDLNTTVLVIEAGKFDENEDFTRIPLITSANVAVLGNGAKGTKYDWNLTSSPQTELQDRIVSLPAGKVIGGGTVLNGMVFMRGSVGDYDRWEVLGNPGWNFKGMFPYFKKAEKFTPPDAELMSDWGVSYVPEYHGYDGFVRSSFPNYVWPSTRYFISSMIELGVSILKDAMGGVNAGAYFFALSENPDDETRSTSATFLPVPPRQNLYLLLGHQATKVVLDTTHSGKVEATGVECASNVTELPLELAAAKEVILSAGALHTPQILMLSGIGDERHLSSVGIQTVVDLPGVGANHHDHPLIISAHSINVSVQVTNFTNNATWAAEQRALYDEEREGPYTTVGGNFFAFLPFSNLTTTPVHALPLSNTSSLPSATHPTVLAGYLAQRALLLKSLASSSTATMELIFSDTIILPGLQTPFSRGHIALNSTSAFTPPIIDPRYLSDPLDTFLLAMSFNYSRLIRTTNALRAVAILETYPGSAVETEMEIEEFVRGSIGTLNHHAGTTAMMPRELGGVVDAELRVYGVEGLRVVDAGIIPILPAAHIQSTVYAVAEKGADLIKKSWMK